MRVCRSLTIEEYADLPNRLNGAAWPVVQEVEFSEPSLYGDILRPLQEELRQRDWRYRVPLVCRQFNPPVSRQQYELCWRTTRQRLLCRTPYGRLPPRSRSVILGRPPSPLGALNNLRLTIMSRTDRQVRVTDLQVRVGPGRRFCLPVRRLLPNSEDQALYRMAAGQYRQLSHRVLSRDRPAGAHRLRSSLNDRIMAVLDLAIMPTISRTFSRTFVWGRLHVFLSNRMTFGR